MRICHCGTKKRVSRCVLLSHSIVTVHYQYNIMTDTKERDEMLIALIGNFLAMGLYCTFAMNALNHT